LTRPTNPHGTIIRVLSNIGKETQNFCDSVSRLNNRKYVCAARRILNAVFLRFVLRCGCKSPCHTNTSRSELPHDSRGHLNFSKHQHYKQCIPDIPRLPRFRYIFFVAALMFATQPLIQKIHIWIRHTRRR